MLKDVTILGSTGSIGLSTLRVLRFLGNDFRIHGLSCKRNIKLLREQIIEFNPSVVAVEAGEVLVSDAYKSLKREFNQIEFLEGDEGVIELAGRSVDVIVSAIVGAAGLKPSLEAINGAKRIALANKETLVMAGEYFISKIHESSVELIPVDSEHSAIFSLISNISIEEVEKIILTASGGSLRDIPANELGGVTPEMALNHPTWSMGNKITIDSATMMNKGLEVIEAHYLFNIGYESIDVIIHPESVVHSIVESVDGSMYAHMGVNDMTLPILNALKYPEKVRNSFGRLDLEKLGAINFSACDRKKYPALELCYSAGKSSGTMPVVLNAANEIAVDAFLKGKINFTDIVKVVEKTMSRHRIIDQPGIDEILNADIESREISKSYI